MPSTASAATFHAYQAFYQTQEWNTLMERTLDPTDWGWILENYDMVPVMTDMDPVPCELPNVICCNCNVSTKNPCQGKQCSCQSNGLKRVAACGNYHSIECQNCIPIIDCKDDEKNILLDDDDGYNDFLENLNS